MMHNKYAMKRMPNTSSIAVVFSLAVIFISCGSGEGTLTVTTYPVTGTITVDGESSGEAPVTLTIASGNHEIRFSDYSDQYRAPGTRIVKIRAGKHKMVTGEYSNRFIPREVPAGFSLSDSLRIYGTADRHQKDGTIFDYINGGGLAYLKYGLTETTHIIFSDNYLNSITVDIFDMGTSAGAQSVFEDEDVCPSGFVSCDTIMNCKAYHYEPDYLIYFHKSKYLVYLSTANDSLKTVVDAFGASIAGNIP